ncbi:efflux RND transporter permease subunit [Thalassomonas viridans]|uniref:Efflux RND transporter permease subunit n=1 Tax=Thalassomonas viridans TaxID=137584 RepID=A0AAF0C964_9GAMM|nr:efflux RND transporter permease subunit [Thalassomonas viridans]WDE05458.1 efflux RND transporter permease subunit [Thalassomonas viridans]
MHQVNQPGQEKTSVMDIFVHRPVVALVLSIVICLAGLWAVTKIPVLQFPKIESSSLVISTNYTGASASVVQGFVSEPIERVAASVPGVEYVDSVTNSGHSTVTAWLKLNENSTHALAELNARLSQIRFELPPGAEDPVVSVSRTDRPFAVFYLNVHAKDISRSELTDYLTRQVNPIINGIEGVQRVGVEGARTPAMRVWLDADRLSVFNLSAEEVYNALAANNTIATLGYSENNRQRIDIIANSQLSKVSEFERLVVKKVDDAVVYLKDVAKVELGAEEASVTARLDREDTVYISVWPLPGANEIAIGDRLYKVLDEVNASLPSGMSIDFAYDGTLYMRDALKEIFSTLTETVILVGLVVLMLMGSFRSALVPLVTIPISILGAVAAMSAMGFSLNLLTVLAIVLSVGLVVDDAIVVVENVARFMRQGMSRTRAALLSSRQLLVPIIAMTLTLAAVYAPIGFLSGLTGVLFKEFAFTLAIAVIISGIVAITLSPIMSAYVSPRGGEEGWLTAKVNGIFDRVQRRYAEVLARAFHWQGQIFLVALVVSLLVIPFYLFSAKELAPIEDQSSINVVVQAPPESSLSYNVGEMQQVVADLLQVEGGTHMWQIVQTSGGFGGLELVSSDERDFRPQQKLPEVYGRLSGIAGLDLLPILPGSLPTAGQFEIELVVKSSDPYDKMKVYADQLVGAAFQSGKFLFADTDLKIDLPQLELKLNREKIADLGMNISAVSDQLGILLSSNYVNRFDANGKAYRVIPIVGDEVRSKPETILDLTLKLPDGELIPVSAIAELNWQTGPRKLGTFGQQKSFRVYGGVLPGTTKEEALSTLEAAAAEILPPSYSLDYAGESRQLRKEGNTLLAVLAVSLLIVYLVLAVQFNSFRDPLVVLLGCVPLALSGALLLPYIELTTINIYSQIGLITLIGLIAKNGILIVEFANHMQEQGMDKLAAVTEAATTRLRPILMTTAATVLGHFPLVLVTGAGAEARNSIGIILVAGMLIGTMFTLFVLPAFYLWLATSRDTDKAADVSLTPEMAA